MAKLMSVADWPHVYGWEHIVYLVIFFAASAGSLAAILLKVKKEKTLDIIVKVLGGVLLALIIWNRICISIHKLDWWYLIPDSFCGLSSLLLAVCAICLKRNSIPFHCLCYISFWGGAIVTFYPDFLGQASSFMYPATISGLLHHSLALYLSVLMIATGYLKPSVKKFYAFPIGLCFMLIYGMFLIDAGIFKTAMYIGKPLIEGSFLTWYVMAILLIGGTFGLVFLYEFLMKKRRIKKIENAKEITAAEEETKQ